MTAFLSDPILAAPHGFGLRTSPTRDGVLRAVQVHGAVVADADAGDAGREADAIVTATPGRAVAVVTADCVPLLVGAGEAAVAIHAGWRGLAAGVVEAGVAALAARDAAPPRAAVGPHIGPCCYEVDAPVLAGLRPRFGAALDAACAPSRRGHVMLDLGVLARAALLAAGLAPEAVGTAAACCTCCDASRFHSYRRDGAASGRLLHWVAPPL
jgi:YfiH family protein